MKSVMKYSLLTLVLMLAVAPRAHADRNPPKPTPGGGGDKKTAPEVDPSLAITGLALLGGSLSVARARRSKG